MKETVFIVHGRNSGTKETVARFIGDLGLTPVILHEQPNKGRTIIQKFTDHSAVGFAVVVMSPDDRGGLARVPASRYKPRAKQNVVFELGFFLARLGSGNVCALYKPGVEVPSDYVGVGYIELDSAGAWRSLLAREIKAAGIRVDLGALA